MIVFMYVCTCVICTVVRIVVVVSVCMMVVAVLVKSELVSKLSTEVDVIMVISVRIVTMMLVESCLLYWWALLDAFSKDDILVLTSSSIVFAFLNDTSVLFSEFMLVLHL